MKRKVASVDVSNGSEHGPKYLPVYDKLRTRLESGEFRIGTILPTEDELCSEYTVSRYTLREALRVLERQGFIQRRRRAGTRVLAQSSNSVFRHATGSRSDLLEFAKGTTLDLSAPRLIQTDGKLARLLGCDELREWYLLEGLRIDTADHRPIGVTQLYIDASRAIVPANVDFGHRPVYEWLEKTHNVHAKTVSQDICAVALTANEAEVFGERAGDPALRIVRRYFDESQRIFQIALTTHRSKDFVYNTRLSLE